MPLPKLIASDIDGTLIPYGERVLPDSLFLLIRRLNEAGIRFCPASGRQYHSVRRVFAPVADEICCICENGAVIFGPGTEDGAPVLSKTPMPREDALSLAREIMEIPTLEVLISGQNVSYLPRMSAAMKADLVDRIGNRIAPIGDPAEIGEEIIKVSAFCPNGVKEPFALLAPRWKGRFRAAQAGPVWIDFTCSDKGSGLRGLCRALGVSPRDVWAFGDNWNDVGMLETAGTPYLMSSAEPALLERFPRHCERVTDVLESLLDDAKEANR